MQNENPPPPSEANTSSPTATSLSSAPALPSQEVERKLAEAAAVARQNSASKPARLPPPLLPPIVLADMPANRETSEQAAERLRVAREANTQRLLAAACLPERYRSASLADVSRVPPADRAQYARAVELLTEAARGGSIVGLCGSRGPGKTHMACALVRDCCERQIRARYTSAMEIFLAIKREYGRQGGDESQAERQFLEPALLVIDEIHVRGETPWEDVRLNHIIDKRYANLRTTILITNVTRQKLRESVGDSIADRFFDAGGVIECTWPSLRGRLLPASALTKGNQ